MSQVGWVFLDQSGGRHRVGVYHGDASGHVLIHCNYKVIQIDFSVKESKTYSFFIGDEFIEIRIFKEKQGFTYEFFVNKTADTPLNRARKRLFVHDMRWSIGVMLLVVALIAAGSVALIRHNSGQVAKRMAATGLSFSVDNNNLNKLLSQGRNAETFVFFSTDSPEKVYYRFTTSDSTVVSGDMHFAPANPILLPTGFPLRDGDAFRTLYLPSNPRIFYLNFAQPTEQTIAGYFRQAVEAEQHAHPAVNEEKALCLALLTLRNKGWQMLGNLIFQETKRDQNKKYNREAYLRMVREPEFADIIKKNCWDK